MSRFLQIHTLTSYPAALLNRDDAGFAKRIPFGGAVRTRVSSQCLKRHWRQSDALRLIDAPQTVRSRRTFDQLVLAPLVAEGHDLELATEAVRAVMALALGESAKAKAKAKKSDEADARVRAAKAVETNQITVLGQPEIDFLAAKTREVLSTVDNPKQIGKAVKALFTREAKANLAGLVLATGLDAALFGRMVTSDILARGDAALHVAHAFTVHRQFSEADYFSVVDELHDDLGSGHIGNTELTTGLFYNYVVIDVPLLVQNLSGNAELAIELVRRFVPLMATQSPGAKRGSTAPYAHAHLTMVEAGDAQPRSLANAFLKPVNAQGDLVASTYRALGDHLRDLDALYDAPRRRFAAMGPVEALGEVQAERTAPLTALAGWAAEHIEAV